MVEDGKNLAKAGRSTLEQAIAFFARRHTLANLLFLGVMLGGIVAWFHTGKEELPAVTFDFVRVSIRYPGAPAEDVERLVTRPVEEEIRALDGIHQITSASSVGSVNVSVELEAGLPNVDALVNEIRGVVLDVPMPEGVIDDPEVRVYKTDKKAILDVALIHEGARLLDTEQRHRLQRTALALENRLIARPEIHSVERDGWLPEEIRIEVHPERLRRYEVPMNKLATEIRTNHVRQPAGTLEADREPKVTLLSELTTPARLRGLVVQGGFEGQVVRLDQVAEVGHGFERGDSVLKVNGHEAVMFSVVKSPSYGILEALAAVERVIGDFRRGNLKGSPVSIVFLDDESIDLRNRLSIVTTNGAIGFLLILVTLFLFLDVRSGFWVAMGIPFTLAFTMLAAAALGHTVNGVTLSAVIIVLGMIVDDAIVVAENVTRLVRSGVDRVRAVVEGTAYVFLPILASITTTCVAFVPLYFFEGRFGRMNWFLPPIVFLMLFASLFESLFILPGHLSLPALGRRARPASHGGHWFDRVEDGYGWTLRTLVLPVKWVWIAALFAVLAFAADLARDQMRFVLFPNEETRDLVLTGHTPEGSGRYDTARLTERIEDLVEPRFDGDVVGMRTEIARGRHGGASYENEFRILIEIVPKERRARSADDMIAQFEGAMAGLTNFSKLTFRKSRWGAESGSPIEILVQQNDDDARAAVTAGLVERLRALPGLTGVEIEAGLLVPEYRIDVEREKLKRLSIDPASIASTLRAALEGTVLYEFPDGDEEVRVRLTTVDDAKTSIERVLAVPVENQGNYLVPIGDLVKVRRGEAPAAITRIDLKRTTRVYADIEPEARLTPLEAAAQIETAVFPEILAAHPTAALSFTGEVEETRESGRDFANAVALAIFLIYAILAVLFDSPWKPIVILIAVPFGVAGVVLAFWLHGKLLFGLFAAVGLLGLAGVVVNDSIILVVKLDDEVRAATDRCDARRRIAAAAQTRLRAVLLTTITTVAGLAPTAYGLAGYDAMLAEMMLALTWGLVAGTLVTLVLVPCLYAVGQDLRFLGRRLRDGRSGALA